jgi:hypothetical protein
MRTSLKAPDFVYWHLKPVRPVFDFLGTILTYEYKFDRIHIAITM